MNFPGGHGHQALQHPQHRSASDPADHAAAQRQGGQAEAAPDTAEETSGSECMAELGGLDVSVTMANIAFENGH